MILNHQKFDYGATRLIEKVIIQAPFRFSVDFPDDACFIYFEEGNTLVNSAFEQIAISARESMLLKCGTYFSDLVAFPSSDRYEIIVIHLPQQVLRKIYKHEFPRLSGPVKSGPCINKMEARDLIREYIKGLRFYFNNPRVVSDELLELKIKELILLLLQTGNAESIGVLFKQLFTPQQADIREVINNHVFSNLKVEDLAMLCHMSISSFKRQFKAIFSDTPMHYIRKRRLERAAELLRVSTLTISEIAFETGFADAAHFSNAFKSAHNLSPSDYRQQPDRPDLTNP